MKVWTTSIACLVALAMLVDLAPAQDGEGGGRPAFGQRPGGEGGGRPSFGGQGGGQAGQRGGRPMFIMPIMVVLDVNKDGELSLEEVQNAVANLAKLDKNGDKKISREELAPKRPEGQAGPQGQRPQGQRPEGQQGRSPGGMMGQLDKNGDGDISKEEAGNDERAKMMFDRLDTDKNGVITAAEMEAMRQRFQGGGQGRGGQGGQRGGPRGGGEGGGGNRPARPGA